MSIRKIKNGVAIDIEKYNNLIRKTKSAKEIQKFNSLIGNKEEIEKEYNYYKAIAIAIICLMNKDEYLTINEHETNVLNETVSIINKYLDNLETELQ